MFACFSSVCMFLFCLHVCMFAKNVCMNLCLLILGHQRCGGERATQKPPQDLQDQGAAPVRLER